MKQTCLFLLTLITLNAWGAKHELSFRDHVKVRKVFVMRELPANFSELYRELNLK